MEGPQLEPVVLTAGPVVLDLPRLGDVPTVAAAFADPDIALWNPGAKRPGATLEDRARLWVAERSSWSSEHCSWVVRADGRMVGAISLHQVDLESGTAEIGYWLVPEGRGRGLGTHALLAAARFGFDVLELARLELFHAVENAASCRLAARCGFLLEGTARQSFVYGDGLRHDEHLHARLATDPDPAPPASAAR